MAVNMVPVNINGKWELLLPDFRAAREEWPYWEKERLASMHELLKPGDVVYDIGAEEGDLSALFASWGCEMVLFEPGTKVWANIKAIFEANGLETPNCFQGFAADTTSPGARGRLAWPNDAHKYEPAGDHGFSNLSERPDIQRITIDDMAAYGAPVPDAITMDVEGAEFEVIKGAEQTLRNHRPLVWISEHPEFMFNMYNRYMRDLHDLMEAFGYKHTLLAYDHELHVLWQPIENL